MTSITMPLLVGLLSVAGFGIATYFIFQLGISAVSLLLQHSKATGIDRRIQND